MSDEEDPEVIADRFLRASTERDTTRTAKEPKWIPPVIVDKVPCRARCGAVCEWTEEAEYAFQAWNRQLASKMDAPLDKTKIVFCEACVSRGMAMVAKANRDAVDRLAVLIRQLKAADDPDKDRELIEKIRKLNHPDVEGLLQCLRDKKSFAPKARRGGV